MPTEPDTEANGGNLLMPQIVKDISDEDGNVLAQFSPVVVRRMARVLDQGIAHGDVDRLAGELEALEGPGEGAGEGRDGRDGG